MRYPNLKREKRQIDQHPRRLAMIAALHFYYLDPQQRREAYETHRYHGVSRLFADLRKQTPESTPLQLIAHEFLPPGESHLVLYICAQEDQEPSHYITFAHKEGRWHLASLHVKARGPRLLRGTKLTWPFSSRGTYPLEDPTLFTIAGDKNPASELFEDWEFRRQLSHCVIVADLHSSLSGQNLLWLRNSRAPGRYGVVALTDSGDGYANPYSFTPGPVRPSSSAANKPRLTVYADATGYDLFGHEYKRYILPTAKRHLGVLPEDKPWNYILPKLLRSLIVPYVALIVDKNTYYYGLSYERAEPITDSTSEVVTYFQTKRAMCKGLWLRYYPGKNIRKPEAWEFSRALLIVFRDIIAIKTPEAYGQKERLDRLVRFFDSIGITNDKELRALYAQYSVGLQDDLSCLMWLV